MLAVTGFRTTIVQELIKLVPEPVVSLYADLENFYSGVPTFGQAKRFVLAAGVLHQKSLREQSLEEVTKSVMVNLVGTMKLCDVIISHVKGARVCIVGSESGFTGSFDGLYAACKAGIHTYVETKRVASDQQVFAVAPTIISDSGMTQRRKDYPGVLKHRQTVTAARVAKGIYGQLYTKNFSSNFVDRITC